MYSKYMESVGFDIDVMADGKNAIHDRAKHANTNQN